MTRFTSDIQQGKNFILQFETDNRKHFLAMQDMARKCIDKATLHTSCTELTHDLHGCEADIVRKMHDKLAQYIGTYTEKDKIPIIEMFRLLDKFEKEMLNDE